MPKVLAVVSRNEADEEPRTTGVTKSAALQTLPEQRMPDHDRNARTCTTRYAYWACAERAARAEATTSVFPRSGE